MPESAARTYMSYARQNLHQATAPSSADAALLYASLARSSTCSRPASSCGRPKSSRHCRLTVSTSWPPTPGITCIATILSWSLIRSLILCGEYVKRGA
jgi:hypothetical protein